MKNKLTFAIASCLFFSTLFSQSLFDIAPSLSIEHTVNTELVFGGHGVSFFDFDNDGWDDISFVQEDDSLVFYKNNNGTLDSIPSFVYTEGETRQVLWADYDNDGDNDLFVTSTNGKISLFENDGNFNFTDITQQSGFSEFTANNYGVSLADYDKDGYLDVYVARYAMGGNENDESVMNLLYKNNGDGTFSDVTNIAGVGDSVQPSFMGVWIDINKNSYPDLYVINDRVLWGNTLYLNNGDGTFTDITTQSGLSMFGEDPMGVMVGDYNNNGNLDILLSNGGPPTKPPRFYINNGDLTYTENANNLGINVFDTFMCTWGGTWIDIDNNTFQDMYLTNGFLQQATGEVENYFFRNNSGLSFTLDNSIFSGNPISASYSVAKGDIDNNGYADLVVQNAKEYNSFIWKNDFGPVTGNNYLKVTLEGTTSNRMAIGSWVEVFIGNKTLTHYTMLGENFISQNSQHHIFGLGAFNSIDSIKILYPSGHKDTYYNLPANEHYYFYEGETISAFTHVADTLICENSELYAHADKSGNVEWSTGAIADSLLITSSGDYYYTWTSPKGIVVKSDTVSVKVSDFPVLSADVSHQSCYDIDDAEAQILVYHDTTGINAAMSWEDGFVGFYRDSLESGNYEIYYSDSANCSDTILLNIQSPDELVNSIIIENETNGGDGEIDVFSFGGTPPYNYSLNGNQATPPFTNLVADTFILETYDNNQCLIMDTIIVSSVLSIDSENSSDPFRIFPNPVKRSGYLTIDIGNSIVSEYQIFDVFGKQVASGNFANNKTKIELNRGVYFLRIPELTNKSVKFIVN